MDSCLLPRPKKVVVLFSVIAVVWCSILVYLAFQDYIREEEELLQEVALLREDNLQLHQTNNDVRILAAHMSRYLIPYRARNVTGLPDWTGLSFETLAMLKNLTGLTSLMLDHKNISLQMSLPTIFDILPHLRKSSDSLEPAFRIARGSRQRVSMVLGVPTVKRDKQSYLMTALNSFLSCMSLQEESDTLMVVFIAETDVDYVRRIADKILAAFPRQVASGLIEIISPPASFYPDWSSMPATLGDPHERFKWRSKEIIDYVFIMMYAQERGRYFAQLEDDIVTKPGFVSTMRDFADKKTANKEPWFVIEFTELGSIGKMFRSSDLPFVINYYIMFYTNQPVDWLLPRIIAAKLCGLDMSWEQCRSLEHILWIRYKPALFQHIGTHSSLKGKLQRLKDSSFGTLSLFYPHKNPDTSDLVTSLAASQAHTLERAYQGKDYFWSEQAIVRGDHVRFNYDPPVNLATFLFRSGNVEQPLAQFFNTTVEVLPAFHEHKNANEADSFVVLGGFDVLGVAKGNVSRSLWPISALRLNVHCASEHGALLSEILLTVDKATKPKKMAAPEVNKLYKTKLDESDDEE